MIVIGSTAIKHHFPDFPREPKDKDYAKLDGEAMKNKEREEYPIPFLCVRHKGYSNGDQYATPDELYTLKVSHLFWDINWDKHIFDAVFLKKKGCRIDEDLLLKLYKLWTTVHGPKQVADYNKSAEDFFDNALKQEYDHDEIHKILKNPPTFHKVLIDEVNVSKEKFKALSEEEKLDLIREEVYVMAWERQAGRNYKSAYMWMLKDFILRHAPVYQARHIIEHYDELRLPEFNYIEKINHELSRVS